MKSVISILTVTVFLFSACTGSGTKENKQANAEAGMPQADVEHHNDAGEDMHHYDMEMGAAMEHGMDSSRMAVQESQATSVVIDTYLKLKNALVADNDKEASRAGKELMTAFNNIDQSSMAAEEMSEVKDIIEDARENAEHISENQGNIDHQREHFEMLSTDIKDLIAIAGADRTLYQIFCPMYNNNEGGMWLSATDEIKNPYYGSEMMNCGEVKSILSVK
jgi:hypothetical protein